VDAESKAQFRPVTVGQLMNDRWIIADGLQTGERVVVDGGMKLAPGVSIKPVETDTVGAPATGIAPSQG
jgi:membrane fusion protein (multidrug efflux system)